MSQAREAEVFQYLLLANHLEQNGNPAIRPGSAELQALGLSVADLYAGFSLQPPEPFPTGIPADSGGKWTPLFPHAGCPPWAESSGNRACRAFAYLDQGAVVLQLAAGQHEVATGPTWNHLRAALGTGPKGLPDSHFFLGSLICYGGRVADEPAAQAAAEAALPASRPGQPGHIRCVCVGASLWLCDRLGHSDTLALFCADNDKAEAQASEYFNDVLPTAFIYLRKIAYLYDRRYQTGGRARLRRLEDQLAKTLVRARRAEPDTNKKAIAEILEGQLREVARAFGDFAAELAMFKEAQNTIAVNASNLRELLDKHCLPREGLPADWLAVVDRAETQLAADDRYYEARSREVEITLRVIEARAELAREEQERRENDLADKRNFRLNWLILAVTVILTFVSDDICKALVHWWTGSGITGEVQLGELLIAKLTMGLLMAVGLSLLWLGLGKGLPLLGHLSKKGAGKRG